MSTSETVTLNKGSCPCGNGHIAQHVTTQDNPWSGADICYSIECARCRADWRLDGDTSMAVLRSSETDFIAAQVREHSAYQSFNMASSQLIANYFSSFSARFRKHEHAEMVRLNITSMSYRHYLTHRGNGNSVESACHGERNTPWLLRQAAGCSRQSEIAELLDLYEKSRRSSSEAARRIVRRRVC
jgi:hypothetical protein